MATGPESAPVADGEPIELADALPVVARGFAQQMLAVHQALKQLDVILAATGMRASLSIVTRDR